MINQVLGSLGVNMVQRGVSAPIVASGVGYLTLYSPRFNVAPPDCGKSWGIGCNEDNLPYRNRELPHSDVFQLSTLPKEGREYSPPSRARHGWVKGLCFSQCKVSVAVRLPTMAHCDISQTHPLPNISSSNYRERKRITAFTFCCVSPIVSTRCLERA